MADVFISYSRTHRALTEALANDLESKGLDIWWDTDLLAGEDYRERIMSELKGCRAAIVIWTPESVRSAYVLSEAERARRDGKLVQVRTADVDPDDLPPPFDTSHVPVIDDIRSIQGGLVRLGVLDGRALDIDGQPTLAPKRKATWVGRAGLLAVLGLAGAVVLGTFGWVMRGRLPAPSAASPPAAIVVDQLLKSLDEKLETSSVFASNLRLGRLGAMSSSEAVAELRKLFESYERVTCRREGPVTNAGGSVGGGGARPDAGDRVTLNVVCDLTDQQRKTTTRAFPLEIEVVRGTSGPVIAGLWQPQEQVLWQPRPRR